MHRASLTTVSAVLCVSSVVACGPSPDPSDGSEESATEQAATATHSHAFDVDSRFNDNSWASPSYVTHTRAQSCVTVSEFSGGGCGWGFSVVWYDGGANERLWTSRTLNKKGTVCSPEIFSLPSHRQNKVYDIVSSYGYFGCNARGALHLTTD